MTTVREALASAAERLGAAGVADAEREAGWMMAHLLGSSAGALRLRSWENLSAGQIEAFSALVARRAGREPLQYILGTEEFLGLTFKVSPAVLIPRLDTERLVEQAAALLDRRGAVRVADIGTGSGAIAVGIAHLLPSARVVAIDLSPEALAVARENATANGVADRIEFRQGDLLAPLGEERFDAILSNPPYIGLDEMEALMPEVRDWEPHLALTPGPDGLLMYRSLALGAPALLRPGGILAVEVGFEQAASVVELFHQAGLVKVRVYQDTAGVDRVVVGTSATEGAS